MVKDQSRTLIVNLVKKRPDMTIAQIAETLQEPETRVRRVARREHLPLADLPLAKAKTPCPFKPVMWSNLAKDQETYPGKTNLDVLRIRASEIWNEKDRNEMLAKYFVTTRGAIENRLSRIKMGHDPGGPIVPSETPEDVTAPANGHLKSVIHLGPGPSEPDELTTLISIQHALTRVEQIGIDIVSGLKKLADQNEIMMQIRREGLDLQKKVIKIEEDKRKGIFLTGMGVERD